MSYIYVKVMPNFIPITKDSDIHYCSLEFIVYRSELSPAENTGIREYRTLDGGIKKGPEITVSAKMAKPDSADSEDALCVTNDVPSGGYAYSYPDGWGCSHSCEGDLSRLTFVFSAPVGGGESFETAVIRVNGFFTTAQEGACGLRVRVSNFRQFVPDAEDSEFTVAMSKKYGPKICRFTANEKKNKFFINHRLPVLFHWDVVCDADTPLSLLEDDILVSGLQEFSGEKLLEEREKGDHTYTLKMSLQTGDRTENIRIRDTLWRKLKPPAGLTPDFSMQGRFLTCRKTIYLFYDSKVYRADAGKGQDWQNFQELCKYDGDVIFSPGTVPAAWGDKLYLTGGTKSGSSALYYAVYDLKGKNGGWAIHDMWQSAQLAGGVSACETSASCGQWIIYAKREGEHAVFTEYDESTGGFAGRYGLSIPGMSGMEISVRKNVLYLAATAEDEIVIKRLKKGENNFADAGTIIPEAMPKWMRWAAGGNEMFLWTEKGLYREKGWEMAEDFQPPCPGDAYPWCGGAGGKLICLLPVEKGSDSAQAWETDVLP